MNIRMVEAVQLMVNCRQSSCKAKAKGRKCVAGTVGAVGPDV